MAKKKKYEEVYEQLIQARNLNTSDEVAKAEKYVNENRPGPKTRRLLILHLDKAILRVQINLKV